MVRACLRLKLKPFEGGLDVNASLVGIHGVLSIGWPIEQYGRVAKIVDW